MDNSINSNTPKVAEASVNQAAKSGAAIDDCEWEMILGEVDINGDGVISFDEFLEMIFKIFGMERKSTSKRQNTNLLGPAINSLQALSSKNNHSS
jgi:hypothetical protein